MGLAASRQEAFWEACGFGNVEKVRKFLQDGDVDVNWVSYTGCCLEMLLSMFGVSEGIGFQGFCLEIGHDSCPIHVASQGKPEIVKMLIDAKCNVCARDIRGNMAIHHAAMKGHGDIIKMLVDAGSEVNCQDKNGWTPLHNAAYWCQLKAVKVLLECGSDVSIQNKDQRTALLETARSQERRDDELGEIAKLLIDAGSDINAKSSDLGDADLTGLIYAAYHNHPEVALAFIEAGCVLDAVGTTMWTALHWAADRGNDELVYILLEAGADPTVKGMRGELAANRAKSSEVKELLLNAVNMHHEVAAVNLTKSESSHSLQNKSFSKSVGSHSVQNKSVNRSTNSSSVDKSVNKSESSHSFQDKLVNKSASSSSIEYDISITKSGSNMSVKSGQVMSVDSDSSFSHQCGQNEVKPAEVIEAATQLNLKDGSHQVSNIETEGSPKSESISIIDCPGSTMKSLLEIDQKISTQVEQAEKNTNITRTDDSNSQTITPVQVEEKISINDDSKSQNINLVMVEEKNNINDDSKNQDEDNIAIVEKP